MYSVAADQVLETVLAHLYAGAGRAVALLSALAVAALAICLPKFFYVTGKALSDKLSCIQTGLFLTCASPINILKLLLLSMKLCQNSPESHFILSSVDSLCRVNMFGRAADFIGVWVKQLKLFQSQFDLCRN